MGHLDPFFGFLAIVLLVSRIEKSRNYHDIVQVLLYLITYVSNLYPTYKKRNTDPKNYFQKAHGAPTLGHLEPHMGHFVLGAAIAMYLFRYELLLEVRIVHIDYKRYNQIPKPDAK